MSATEPKEIEMNTGKFEDGVLKADALKDRFTNEVNRKVQPESKVEIRRERRFLNALYSWSREHGGAKVDPETAERIQEEHEEERS